MTLKLSPIAKEPDMELQAYLHALKLEPVQEQQELEVPQQPTKDNILPDNLDWLFESPELIKWQRYTAQPMLWLGGKSPAENTKAVGQLVRRLSYQSNVFCSYHPSTQQPKGRESADEVAVRRLKNLLHRVLDDDPRRFHFAIQQYPLAAVLKPAPYPITAQEWMLHHLVNVLFCSLTSDPEASTVLLLDGIDGLGIGMERIITQLHHLMKLKEGKTKAPNFKVFFSSAPKELIKPSTDFSQTLNSILYIEKEKEMKSMSTRHLE